MTQDFTKELSSFFSLLWEEKRANKPVEFFEKLAWDLFLEKGLPTRNQEAFQYVSLRKMYEGFSKRKKVLDQPVLEKDLSSLILSESKDFYLVFVDGFLSLDLSKVPASCKVFSLDESLAKGPYRVFLQRHLDQVLRKEKDPWALLNAALAPNAVFMYVPPKTVFECPLQIIHLQTKPSSPYLCSRMHVFMGAESTLHMLSTWSGCSNPSFFCHDFLDVVLEEKAAFSHVFSAEEQSSLYGQSSLRVSAKKESRLDSYFITLGSSGFRRDYDIALLGEKAEARLKGLTALSGHSESHVHVHMEHAAPSCISEQLFKNVLHGQSRSSFTGKIYVKQVAQKTEAYQMNKNLLLSDDVSANTKPNLEIFADDVKASHGATISQLEEEQLLYLQTRGISASEAKSLLTMGFCWEILEEIPFVELKKNLSSACRDLLLR